MSGEHMAARYWLTDAGWQATGGPPRLRIVTDENRRARSGAGVLTAPARNAPTGRGEGYPNREAAEDIMRACEPHVVRDAISGRVSEIRKVHIKARHLRAALEADQ